MFTVPSRIVSFVIVAAGISILAGSAMAITRKQARAECRKELGVTENAGGLRFGRVRGGYKKDGGRFEYCFQQKMGSQGKK
jgi:hypothetical protein